MRENRISTIAGDGVQGNLSEDGVLAIHSQLNCPEGIAIHSSGDIYFVDRKDHRVRKVSCLNGTISTIAGNGTKGFYGDDGLAVDAQLNNPVGIAIHPNTDDIYISDYCNHRIRKVSSADGTISTIAGNGTKGFLGDGGLAVDAQLYNPVCIAIHPNTDDIYISDNGNNRIRKISSVDGIISTIAGNGKSKENGVLAIDSQFYRPFGIAIHPFTGDIYIVDRNNQRIRKIAFESGIISTIAGTGRSGFDGDGGLATNAQLDSPLGIVIHPNSGDIYFTDYGNHRIRKIAFKSGIISTIAGNGTAGFSEDVVFASNAQLNNPVGIAINSTTGDIYFTDYCNRRIRKVNSLTMSIRYKKHERDIIKGTNLTCCKSVFQIYSPRMFNLVMNEKFINYLNVTQLEIIQHLIDLIIYNNETDWVYQYDTVDVLFLLGMIVGDVKKIIFLTRTLIGKFVNSFSEESCPELLKKTIALKDDLKNQFPLLENELLDQMIEYSLDKAAEFIKKSSLFVFVPIITLHILRIAARISSKVKSSIVVNEDALYESDGISLYSLFNNKTTSDVTIKIGNNEYYCHKTILSSNSSFYEALFNSGFEFQDLKENVHTVDTSEFDEFSQECILKYCYGMFEADPIPPSLIGPIFECANVHGMKGLSECCIENLVISVDDFCNLVQELGTDTEKLVEKFIEFGKNNAHELLGNREIFANIPIELRNEIVQRYFQK